jgi:hypothetical protein
VILPAPSEEASERECGVNHSSTICELPGRPRVCESADEIVLFLHPAPHCFLIFFSEYRLRIYSDVSHDAIQCVDMSPHMKPICPPLAMPNTFSTRNNLAFSRLRATGGIIREEHGAVWLYQGQSVRFERKLPQGGTKTRIAWEFDKDGIPRFPGSIARRSSQFARQSRPRLATRQLI